MTRQQRIEKKGYKVTFHLGYRDGVQCITNVSAYDGKFQIVCPNITRLHQRIFGY